MAIPDIPTIEEIKNRIVSDVQTSVNQTIPGLPLAFVNVLASALAFMIFLLYQAILWVYKQIFPESADFFNLVLLGAIIGITPVEAVFAVLLCDVPGTGPQVNQGTLFVGSNEITYQVTTTTAIVLGVASNVPLQALTSGDIGNLINGEILNITQTDLNLDGTATVTSTQTSGADQESDDSFSARVSLGYRTRKIAGSVGGYTFYGLETPNFIWIGVYGNLTLPGTVDIYGRVNNQTDGIPTAAQLLELENFLNFVDGTGKAYRRAISDTLNLLPISVREFDLEIFINNGAPGVNADIETAVQAYATGLEPFIIGSSDSRKNILTNTDTASEGNEVAKPESAFVTLVVITDVVTGFVEIAYTLLGGEFVKFRNVTFTVVV